MEIIRGKCIKNFKFTSLYCIILIMKLMLKKFICSYFILLLVLISGCANGVKFETDNNGNKKYKKENGNYAQNEWVTIKNNDYFFDMNGNLMTNTWVYDEYFVDEEGKKKKDYWYKGTDGTYYYLDDTGKYLVNTTIEIDGKNYAFDVNGGCIMDRVFVSPNEVGKLYFSGKDGVIVKKSGAFVWNGNNYYIDDDGYVFNSGWKEIDNNWFYYAPDGTMQKNVFVDTDYYVDENGVMVSNTSKNVNGITYNFDAEGKVIRPKVETKKATPKAVGIDFDYLYSDTEGAVVAATLMIISDIIKYYYDAGYLNADQMIKIGKVFCYISEKGATTAETNIDTMLDYLSGVIGVNGAMPNPKINLYLMLMSLIDSNFSFYSAYTVNSDISFTQYITGLETNNHTAYYDSQSKMILETIKSTLPLEYDNGFDVVIFDRTNTGSTVAEFANIKINNKYILIVHLDSIEMNPIILKYSLIHEYGHYLTLNDRQYGYDPYSTERKASDGKVPLQNSYLKKFIEIFWNEIPNPYARAYYDPHRYVREYAASNVKEDIAESFAYFVLFDAQEGYDMAELKINFFYQYPEMVNIRISIRARIVLSEFQQYW